MTQQERLEAAVKELIQLCIKDHITLEFMPPLEDPQEEYGHFIATQRTIHVFKDRTMPINIFHVYALAHEYAHSLQFKRLDGYDSWLFDLGVLASKSNQTESARLENEADQWAVSFLKERKIRLTKRLKTFLEDREEYHTGVINGD
jgi:hypothetical protein